MNTPRKEAVKTELKYCLFICTFTLTVLMGEGKELLKATCCNLSIQPACQTRQMLFLRAWIELIVASRGHMGGK